MTVQEWTVFVVESAILAQYEDTRI